MNDDSWQQIWDRYWYEPLQGSRLVSTIRLFAAIAIVWFISLLLASDFWWGSPGFADSQFAATLEAYSEGDWPVRFRLSPLWQTNSYAIVAVVCAVGIGLCIATAWQPRRRTLRFACFALILLLAQRQGWARGPLEPLLIAMSGYLAIAKATNEAQWSNRLSMRLVQWHTWMLLCAAAIHQLSYEAWWQGSAVWWLSTNSPFTAINSRWLEGRILLVNVLTHSITIATIVAACCLWPCASSLSRSRAVCGTVAGAIVAVSYALLAGQLLYGALLMLAINTKHPKL